MTRMTDQDREVTVCVDTRGETYHAAVVDRIGRHLADRVFPATGAGHRQLLSWLHSHGKITAAGARGISAYGANLTVIEVTRPDRKARRTKDKSDPIDAHAVAASGRASDIPKTHDGVVEATRLTAGPPPLGGQGPHTGRQPGPTALIITPDVLHSDQKWDGRPTQVPYSCGKHSAQTSIQPINPASFK
ncbi:hypothetical protein ACIQF6_04850 [Kitasatospora sp. NPDC092948]|uniref:hypothetical protein n=1 Tax=Kitasatospora sp. NPDC092948 TaxID=3364088 RepID=UPI00381101AA